MQVGPRQVELVIQMTRAATRGGFLARSRLSIRVCHEGGGMGLLCEDCHGKQPSYGTPEERKNRWCSPCGKKRGAIRLIQQAMCEDCHGKQPSYGTPEERKNRWCSPYCRMGVHLRI